MELDLDSPYLAIFRDVGNQTSVGIGDTNFGVKWNFHKESNTSRLPALAVSQYFEFPTGNSQRQLGSGLIDYWLNIIGQKSLSEKTRINANTGLVFAGNTSTGALGIQATRGHVYTGGISVLHDVNAKLTLGAELYGGLTSNRDLSRSQFQAMVGGQYLIRNGVAFDFGLLVGKYIASPRIGGQIGFSVDFRAIRPKSPRAELAKLGLPFGAHDDT